MSNFNAGLYNLPIWDNLIKPKKRLNAVDSLSGTYITRRDTILNPGDAVPGYPGMIIMDLEPVDSGQCLRYSIQAEGSLDNSSPTKLLSRSEARSIGPNFATIGEKKISWQTGPKACTGVASTDIITATDGPHGFSDGQRLCFITLIGGAGLQAQSQTAIAALYFAKSTTSTTFKVSTTAGGSAVDFTTNITAGFFIAAEFFPGTTHPLWSNMYLTQVSLSDEMTPWRNADCSYVGKLWDTPYHRVITVAGQQVSSTDKIILSGVADVDDSPHFYTATLPEVVVTDTYVTTNGIPTVSVPSSHSEGGTPPNAPIIRALGIGSDNDDDLVHQWPNGWSLIGVQHIETINSGIPLTIYAMVYQFKIETLLK